ncbi:MAG: hypothetical protein GXO09_02165 [Crenarchaeota archaeon]|nr:hypothetical protein [Thermoproteota archaeon]
MKTSRTILLAVGVSLAVLMIIGVAIAATHPAAMPWNSQQMPPYAPQGRQPPFTQKPITVTGVVTKKMPPRVLEIEANGAKYLVVLPQYMVSDGKLVPAATIIANIPSNTKITVKGYTHIQWYTNTTMIIALELTANGKTYTHPMMYRQTQPPQIPAQPPMPYQQPPTQPPCCNQVPPGSTGMPMPWMHAGWGHHCCHHHCHCACQNAGYPYPYPYPPAYPAGPGHHGHNWHG